MRTSLLEILERALVGNRVRIRYHVIDTTPAHIAYLLERGVTYENGWVIGEVRAVVLEEIEYESDYKVVVIGEFGVPISSDTVIEIL
jgi:hypothetical protein